MIVNENIISDSLCFKVRVEGTGYRLKTVCGEDDVGFFTTLYIYDTDLNKLRCQIEKNLGYALTKSFVTTTPGKTAFCLVHWWEEVQLIDDGKNEVGFTFFNESTFNRFKMNILLFWLRLLKKNNYLIIRNDISEV